MGKIEEVLDVLKQLDVPKKQQNERSALTLLALLGLKEKDSWKDCKKRLIRIHDIIGFIEKNYGKKYAENSRETIRRYTLHQFEKEVGIVERNADDPKRSTNSPNTAWSITDDTLKTIRSYKSKEWSKALSGLVEKLGHSLKKYKLKKKEHKLVADVDGQEVVFSPGRHNELQIEILNDFRKSFCKDSLVVYIGDTANKMLYVSEKLLDIMKMKLEKHDILPDIILLDLKKGRLYLIEAVSSHGPVTNKRMIELNDYFKKVKLKKIYVSAFPDFKEFRRHVDDIAWETEVWISEIPNHMIHFNGDKFLKID